jgi:hypothetical protein
VLLLAGAHPALAQFALIDPLPGYAAKSIRIGTAAEQRFEADVDGGGGFDLLRYEIGADLEAPLSNAFGLGLHTLYQYSGFDFQERPVPGCPGNQPCFELSPWKSIHKLEIAPAAALRFGDAFQIMASVPIRWNVEAGSDASGLTAGILGAVRFAPDERFAVGLGIGVQSGIEESTNVFPVITLDWRIREGLRLLSRGGPQEGGGGVLRWSPSETVALFVAAGWELERFRTNRHGSRNPSGVGQYEAAPLEAGIEIRLTRSVRIEFHSGVAVAGRLKWDGAGGEPLLDREFDAAPLVGGSLRALF